MPYSRTMLKFFWGILLLVATTLFVSRATEDNEFYFNNDAGLEERDENKVQLRKWTEKRAMTLCGLISARKTKCQRFVSK